MVRRSDAPADTIGDAWRIIRWIGEAEVDAERLAQLSPEAFSAPYCVNVNTEPGIANEPRRGPTPLAPDVNIRGKGPGSL